EDGGGEELRGTRGRKGLRVLLRVYPVDFEPTIPFDVHTFVVVSSLSNDLISRENGRGREEDWRTVSRVRIVGCLTSETSEKYPRHDVRNNYTK
ncbi:hypothetical protein ALC53_08580, partial [Atta colombica]